MAESFLVHLSEPQVDKMHPVLRRCNSLFSMKLQRRCRPGIELITKREAKHHLEKHR